MVMYYCEPMPDLTLEEAHAISAVEPMPMLWRKDQIPEGCERHFIPVDESDEHGPGGRVTGCQSEMVGL